MLNLVVISRVRARKRSQKSGGRWGPALLGLGRG